MTFGSSSSRSSTRPRSSLSRVGSRASAAARRSASGESPLVEERADVTEEQRMRERRGLRRGASDQAQLAAPIDARCPSAPAGRRRPAGTRAPSRGRSGSRVLRATSSSWPTAGAAATTAAACPDSAGAGAARGPRTRGTARRTGRCRRPPPSTICSISSGSKRNSSAPGGSSSIMGTRSTMPSSAAIAERPSRSAAAGAGRRPGPTARDGHAEGSAAPRASRPARRGTAPPPACGRWGPPGGQPLLVEVGIRLLAASLPVRGLAAFRGRPDVGRATVRAEGAERACPAPPGRPRVSPFQNGSRPGWPGAGETSTRSWRDVLDPPTGGAEGEDVAHPGLVDHLLVEFAHPARLGRRRPGRRRRARGRGWCRRR